MKRDVAKGASSFKGFVGRGIHKGRIHAACVHWRNWKNKQTLSQKFSYLDEKLLISKITSIYLVDI